MQEITPTTILFLLFGLYCGVMTWLFKTAWSDIQCLKTKYEDIQKRLSDLRSQITIDLQQSLSDRFDKFFGQLDERLDSWWKGIENNLMNDGRLPTKTRKPKE